MTPIDIPFRTGSIIVLSDLHHDHYARRKLDPFAAHGLHQSLRWTADALILAGDLADTPARNWPAAFAFLRRYMPPQRTFVLAGNHDCYDHRLDGDEDLRGLAQAAGFHCVQKQELRHGSTRIFACTLWTDFALTNAPQA
jgi:predicted MPP superfamily phosphohydrolase